MDRGRLFNHIHNQHARLRQALRYLRTPPAPDYLHRLLYLDVIVMRGGAIAWSANLVPRVAVPGRRRTDGPDPGCDRGCRVTTREGPLPGLHIRGLGDCFVVRTARRRLRSTESLMAVDLLDQLADRR